MREHEVLSSGPKSRQHLAIAQAECIAWPFVSINQLQAAQVVCPTGTQQDQLHARLAALGCRESTADLTRSTWKPNERLELYLIRISQRLLQLAGKRYVLKSDEENPGCEILAWRWISLALSADLLIAAKDPDPKSTVATIQLLDPTLRVLEPTAHLHVHATAVLPFSRIWTAVSDELDLSEIKTPPNGLVLKEWKAWLRRAFAASLLLDVWMGKGKEPALMLLNREPDIKHAMTDLIRGKCRFDDLALEASLEGFVRAQRTLMSVRLRERRRRTSSQNKSRRYAEPDPEIMFNRRCLSYLCRYPEDKHFRTIWVQRTRIRAILYRHLVHDPAQRGLDSFAACFNRMDEYGVDRLSHEVTSVISTEQGLQLEAVELRGAPSRLSKLLDEKLKSLPETNAASKSTCPKTSWVLHFIRDGKRPGQNAREIIRRHYMTAEKMILTLKHRPDLLQSVRAIDVASRELSGPLWYVAGPIHRVLSASRSIASREKDLQGLHLTIHAGEDFRHLLSGLRFIHEPFCWGLMRRGDRIGHALALGLNPKLWCDEHPVVIMPRHERMLDLAWMLNFISARKLRGFSSVAMIGAQEELANHLKLWKVPGATTSDFMTLVKNLGRPGIWSQINAPHWTSSHFEHSTVLKLFERLLEMRDDSSSSEMINVATGGDWKDLTHIRDELARLLAKWRTPIEINPSSNLLVGGMKHVMDQPLFHLDASDKNEMRGLVLTLSADDPLCFSTTLSDEYAYAWAGMVIGANVPPAYAHEWLERAARAGRRAAFGSYDDAKAQ